MRRILRGQDRRGMRFSDRVNETMETEWFDSEAFEQAYHCDAPLGAFCGERGTRFALWAPTAQDVTLRLYADGCAWEPFERQSLWKGERGLWAYETDRCLDGVYYDYLVTVDGVVRETGDPYARACGVNGWRSMVIDLARTDPPGWAEDRAPARQAEDIIYELHVKEFSWDAASGVPEAWRGKYKALTLEHTSIGGGGRRPTCLAYLRRLGVTHVELMPVFDYGSVDEAGDAQAFNWGYDPVNYNVPEGSYATDPWHGETRIRELKEAVQALHKSGLRVIMDVVYNHTYHLDSSLFRTVPWYYYRRRADGSASNGSGCGNELATERSMCGKYIFDSVMYWAEEYHIDGFRFDLMGLLDTELINGIQRALDSRFGQGEKLLLGEPWSGGQSGERPGVQLCHKGNLRALHPAVAAFCDDTRDAIKGDLWDPRHAGLASGGFFSADRLARCVRGWAGSDGAFPFRATSQTVSYLSNHDDWTLWDKLVFTLGGGKRFAQLRGSLLRVNRLAAAMLFCCQGHLFMLSGEEFARTKLGVRNSYRTSLRISRLDWKRAYRNRAMVDYYRGLIALRKRLPGLCDKREGAWLRLLRATDAAPGAAAILLDNTGGDSPYDVLLLAFNASQDACSLALEEGEWAVLCDAEDSFLHEHPRRAAQQIELAPVSALILGRIASP